MKRFLAAWIVAAAAPAAFAWGPVGHRIVAETAALLVADDRPTTWGPLLARHRFELGVYAFLPDSLFRHIDGAGGAVEGPTHYLFLDATGEMAKRRGSVDRRIVQFLDLARAELAPVRAVTGGYQPGASAIGDARHVFLGFYDLGVLAHYSGDVAMPYHATADTNGTARGEGGIHIYFESDCVNALEPGLAADVLASARKNRKSWLRAWNAAPGKPVDLVKAVLADSLSTVARVSELDRLHAVIALQPPGSTTNAKRKPPSEGCRAMRSILVDRLARGAALTATLWESVLPDGVDFSDSSGLQFSDINPTPEYLAPQGAAE